MSENIKPASVTAGLDTEINDDLQAKNQHTKNHTIQRNNKMLASVCAIHPENPRSENPGPEHRGKICSKKPGTNQ